MPQQPSHDDELRSILARLSRAELRRLRKELELRGRKPTLLSLTMDAIVYWEGAGARTQENVVRYVEREASKHGLLAPGDRANPDSIRTILRYAAEYRAALERGRQTSPDAVPHLKSEEFRQAGIDNQADETLPGALASGRWKKTRAPAEIMIRNLGKNPDEVYALCISEGIETTSNVVSGLCYRFQLYKKAKTSLAKPGAIPIDIGTIVLQNIDKSPRAIESIANQTEITAALNTIRTLHSYFGLFMELGV